MNEVESLKARIAYLEAREDAMCDLSYAHGVEHGFSLGQTDDEEGLKQSVEPRVRSAVKELKCINGIRDHIHSFPEDEKTDEEYAMDDYQHPF